MRSRAGRDGSGPRRQDQRGRPGSPGRARQRTRIPRAPGRRSRRRPAHPVPGCPLRRRKHCRSRFPSVRFSQLLTEQARAALGRTGQRGRLGAAGEDGPVPVTTHGDGCRIGGYQMAEGGAEALFSATEESRASISATARPAVTFGRVPSGRHRARPFVLSATPPRAATGNLHRLVVSLVPGRFIPAGRVSGGGP